MNGRTFIAESSPLIIVGAMAEGKDNYSAEQRASSKRPPWWKRFWRWTGFGDETVFEWLKLLVAALIPLAIFWFTHQQTTQQQDIENQRAEDEALQAYLDEMSHLILEKNLSDSEEGSPVRVLARARTVSVLESLDDPQRKRTVLLFLDQSELIHKDDPVVSLAFADFTAGFSEHDPHRMMHMRDLDEGLV